MRGIDQYAACLEAAALEEVCLVDALLRCEGMIFLLSCPALAGKGTAKRWKGAGRHDFSYDDKEATAQRPLHHPAWSPSPAARGGQTKYVLATRFAPELCHAIRIPSPDGAERNPGRSMSFNAAPGLRCAASGYEATKEKKGSGTPAGAVFQ